MTNLPTNPTKTELLEQHWLEFLRYVKQYQASHKQSADKTAKSTSTTGQANWESAFWGWYLRFKIAPVEESKPEPTP